MHNCPQKPFGCSCLPGECYSHSVEMIQLIDISDTRAKERKAEDERFQTICEAVAGLLFLLIVWAIFQYSAVPESERLARVHQEVIHVSGR